MLPLSNPRPGSASLKDTIGNHFFQNIRRSFLQSAGAFQEIERVNLELSTVGTSQKYASAVVRDDRIDADHGGSENVPELGIQDNLAAQIEEHFHRDWIRQNTADELTVIAFCIALGILSQLHNNL